MKAILKFLIKFKWYITFPFASLLIWFFRFIVSSSNRFWPYVLNKSLEYFTNNSNSLGGSDISVIANNLAWFINGINAWIPVYPMFTFAFFIIAWRFAFMAVRFFIKAITLGQV